MLLSSGGGVDSVVQLITVLVIFVLVLAITLFVTRWVAGFQKQQMTGKNMQVIETMRLTPNQFVQIVKIGKHYLAIAVSKEQVTLLTELSQDEIAEVTDASADQDFSKVFERVRKTLLQKGNDSADHVQDKDEDR